MLQPRVQRSEDTTALLPGSVGILQTQPARTTQFFTTWFRAEQRFSMQSKEFLFERIEI